MRDDIFKLGYERGGGLHRRYTTNLRNACLCKTARAVRKPAIKLIQGLQRSRIGGECRQSANIRRPYREINSPILKEMLQPQRRQLCSCKALINGYICAVRLGYLITDRF
jgi:hypothetical protein